MNKPRHLTNEALKAGVSENPICQAPFLCVAGPELGSTAWKSHEIKGRAGGGTDRD